MVDKYEKLKINRTFRVRIYMMKKIIKKLLFLLYGSIILSQFLRDDRID